MSKVLVIGGGPAGMFAAYHAALSGHTVAILEKNEKLGKKLFITGKGRCNLTNAADMEELFGNVMSNRKFLYSAFYACDNQSVISFFEKYGLKTKTERGNRVFPESDHSSDVIKALQRALEEQHVNIMLNTCVKELLMVDETVHGVVLSNGHTMEADHVIVATGGNSYAATGSTGDGYRFAGKTGHRIVEPTPSLVPMNTAEHWCADLMGLSLRNVSIQLRNDKKVLYEEFGEMLFTHFGVSGPVILSASAAVAPKEFQQELRLLIDLKPALDMEQLDRRVLRDFAENQNRQFKNALGQLLPARLIPIMIEISGIDGEKKVNEISREERHMFCALVKALPLTVTGLRGWNEAIITKGGVSVKDISPSTMASKKVAGLSFCGEVLDLDAMTGGYNLQIAWSTGCLAGLSVP